MRVCIFLLPPFMGGQSIKKEVDKTLSSKSFCGMCVIAIVDSDLQSFIFQFIIHFSGLRSPYHPLGFRLGPIFFCLLFCIFLNPALLLQTSTTSQEGKEMAPSRPIYHGHKCCTFYWEAIKGHRQVETNQLFLLFSIAELGSARAGFYTWDH